jgi:hypothetical protein
MQPGSRLGGLGYNDVLRPSSTGRAPSKQLLAPRKTREERDKTNVTVAKMLDEMEQYAPMPSGGKMSDEELEKRASELQERDTRLNEREKMLDEREKSVATKEKNLSREKHTLLAAKRTYLGWEEENGRLREQIQKARETLNKKGYGWALPDPDS